MCLKKDAVNHRRFDHLQADIRLYCFFRYKRLYTCKAFTSIISYACACIGKHVICLESQLPSIKGVGQESLQYPGAFCGAKKLSRELVTNDK